MESPSNAVARPVASMKCERAPSGFVDQCADLLRGKLPVGVLGKRSGGLLMRVDDRDRAARAGLGDGIVRAGGQHVATEDQVGFAGGDALRTDAFRRMRNAHVRRHRAVLLRHAGHVQRGSALAFQMRGHAQQGADRDDAGAADAGDQNVVRRVLQLRDGRFRQRFQLRRAGPAWPHATCAACRLRWSRNSDRSL